MDQDLTDKIAQLIVDTKLSAYDAAYVAGAQRLGATLASCDEHDLVDAGLAQLPTSLIAS